jgi:hypothetical protein
VRSDSYTGIASYRLISTDDQEPVQGWYFTYVIEFHGVKDYKEVFPVFVSLEGTEDDSLAAWLLERSARVKKEDWASAELPPRDDNFENAVAYANRRAIERLLEQQSELSLENAERLEKERTKLENLYDYRQKALADKLESVNNVLNRVSESTDPTVRRIIPAWQKNLENVIQLAERTKVERESRLNELRGREQISAQHEIISASFVDIVPATHTPNEDTENQLV